MNKFVILLFASFLSTGLFAQKYFTKTGTVKFFSHTNLEDIKAENRKVVSVLDSKTGSMEFQLLMKGFDFPNDLMEQHFNESYAESDKFPKASFKGSITDISIVDFTKDGTYTADYTGKLTIKDVTKDIIGTATFTIKDGKVKATSKFKVKPTDYNFSIPATVAGKIAEELEIDLLFDYTKK
jgi:polyisoprenoid-binding protein YceI